MTQDMKLRLADFKVEQARPKINKMGIGNLGATSAELSFPQFRCAEFSCDN